MTRRDFAKLSALAAVALTISAASVPDARAEAPLAMRSGDVLTGQLNAMRNRGAKGKRINIFQLVSEPRRLPPPSGLCGLTTGPETFQLVTASDAQAPTSCHLRCVRSANIEASSGPTGFASAMTNV